MSLEVSSADPSAMSAVEVEGVTSFIALCVWWAGFAIFVENKCPHKGSKT